MPNYITVSPVTFTKTTGDTPPQNNVPEPVLDVPECLEISEGDGRKIALQLLDANPDLRPLDETNMIFPNRPVNQDNLLGFIMSIFGLRVSPQGKNILNLNLHPQWWAWIVEIIGAKNAEAFRTPRDGNMDTNELGSDDLKLMSAVYGGGLVEIVEEFVQNGVTWCILRTLDFHSPPVRYADGWYYKGEKLEYRTHPIYFVVRTNRKRAKIVVWLTETGVMVANDVGLAGGKGHENWPLISNGKVAQRKSDLWVYPMPLETTVFKESLVVDGQLVPQTGGIPVMITKYRFHGPDVYGWDTVRGYWYLLSKMLVRGSLEQRDGGNGFDLRVYAQALLDRRRVSAPDCGWIRPSS